MAQLSVPNAPKEYSTQYRELLGVDFQADQTQVDRRRSPDMVNMISDFGGNPVKRDGYRHCGTAYDALVMVDGDMYGIRSTNSLLTIDRLYLSGYLLTATVPAPYSQANTFGKVHHAFVYQSTIYMMTNKALLSFDTINNTLHFVGVGTGMMSIGNVGESAPADTGINNIPLTVIGLQPDGTGGTVLYDKNLFSIYQQVSYQGDGNTNSYKIPNYDKVGTYIKAEVKDNNGDWQEVIATKGTPTHDNSWRIDGTSNLDYCTIVDPTVTLGVTPPVPAVAGEDNVRITFAPYSLEQLTRFGNPTPQSRGYYNETLVNLLKSPDIIFQNARMFTTDRYKVYYSDVNNPYMTSDLSWFDVDSEVVAFTRSNSYLVVLAKDNGKGTIYLASEATRTVDSQTGQTETYYVVKESNSGIGAVASKAVATLSDEPLFLASSGVYGLLTNYLSENYAVNRSSRINRKLCKEANLENAVAIAFNNYFYLAINGRMYVLDGRHKESDRAGNKPFEAYYFEGLPAIESMYVIGDRMYFCDSSKIYTWNDDLGESERYLQGETVGVYSIRYGKSNSPTEPPTGLDAWDYDPPTLDEGEYMWSLIAWEDLVVETLPIEADSDLRRMTQKAEFGGYPVTCRWSSVYDDDGAPHKQKTLMKKGSMVTLIPHYESSCEVTLVKDGDTFTYVPKFSASLNTFDLISFAKDKFTFNGNPVAFDEFTKKKIKKYKRLQIQLANNAAEPFGITQITKTYTYGNYAKR